MQNMHVLMCLKSEILLIMTQLLFNAKADEHKTDPLSRFKNESPGFTDKV